MRKFLLQGRGGDKATKAIEPANSTAERETKLNILGRNEHSPQYTSHLTENKAVEASKDGALYHGKGVSGSFWHFIIIGSEGSEGMHHVFIQGAPNLHGVFFIFTSILNRG